ncbi:DNA-binding response regulator, NarL/FixJ family, contains REC and HTH domains [Pedobacter steynii]|uniref:DNA-binding response regulator, NarL/FixJ family, contains REC and HTH domains n=2 Tax=Pedobacter steynii TaxID=430522 RepID=A0A1G9VWN3_9SPHI|nr:response regulator transcription factor [Pedobacter steynii]SDM76694.1 DNA-binding response regulator, NarL/FixJ family, contains REC and HTH domains [Pedobacter steynii]
MFKRVLIAEDHESASISVRKTLEDLGIASAEYTFYCDDALMHIKKNVYAEQPYDLLITDLSFEEDHRPQKLSSGVELVSAVKLIQPSLKVLVFSAENKAAVVDTLFKELGINGYVRKARHDAKDLKLAIQAIYKNKIYLSEDLKQTIKQKNAYEFTDFDITIISLLSRGMLQKEIPAYLQENNIRPSGLSSIEKRLNLMKEVLGFSKNEQLVAYCKDFGII